MTAVARPPTWRDVARSKQETLNAIWEEIRLAGIPNQTSDGRLIDIVEAVKIMRNEAEWWKLKRRGSDE